MGSCYGDMLRYFPELIRDYEAFKMKPHIGAGYGERYNKRHVRGYWSWRKRSELEVQGDLRGSSDKATFWAKDDFFTGKRVIERGDYIEVEERIFLVVDDDNFSYEGGFTKCTMRELEGITDQQVSNPAVDEAVINDY